LKVSYFIFLVYALLMSTYSCGQIKIRIQGSAAIPTGYSEDIVSVGYGGNLNFSYAFNSSFEVSLTSGYYNFGYKENLPDYVFSFSAVPVLVGFRYNILDYNFIPYIGLEGGAYFSRYNLTIDYGFFGKDNIITFDKSWGISPEVGFKINLTPMMDLDVNAKYNRIKTNYITRAFVLIQSGFSYRF
jgi:outer membrane protein W